jgi:hypothetical protein
VIKKIIDGEITCPEFESIKESILFKQPPNIEKTPNNLFNKFINSNLKKNEYDRFKISS